MKIVIMVDKSAGNESVGEMWTETFIFEDTVILKDVITKISTVNNIFMPDVTLKNVRMQIAQEEL